MDLPLRTRLLGAFVGVVVLSGALTILAGSFLINRMVIGDSLETVFIMITAYATIASAVEATKRGTYALTPPDSSAIGFSAVIEKLMFP